MDLKTLLAKLKQIISNQLGVDEELVVPQAHLVDDLGADSLDAVEIVMALEEEFDCEIPEDDAGKIRRVSDIIDFLKLRLQLSPQPA